MDNPLEIEQLLQEAGPPPPVYQDPAGYYADVASVMSASFPLREQALDWAYRRLNHATDRTFQEMAARHDAAVTTLRHVLTFIQTNAGLLGRVTGPAAADLAAEVIDALGPHRGYLTQLELAQTIEQRVTALLRQQREEAQQLAVLLDQKTRQFTSLTATQRWPVRGYAPCPRCAVRGIYVQAMQDEHTTATVYILRCRACDGVAVISQTDWIDLDHALAGFALTPTLPEGASP